MSNLADIILQQMLESEKGQKLQSNLAYFRKLFASMQTVLQADGEEDRQRLKIGTVLALELMSRARTVDSLKDLTKDDWKAITEAVVDQAVLANESSYIVFVFRAYAAAIDKSTDLLAGNGLAERRVEALRDIVAQLDEQSQSFYAGAITEQVYIENCLWLSLEGMVKLISGYIGLLVINPEWADLLEHASQFAFEYARYTLYRREHALLTRLMERQYQLDEELAVEWTAYQDLLKSEADRFNKLFDQAFDADFQTALRGSAALARELGVEESEILETEEDIDDFFLG